MWNCSSYESNRNELPLVCCRRCYGNASVVVVDALFVVTNFGGTMNNVSPTFSIPDHLQYFVCRQVGPVCNVVDVRYRLIDCRYTNCEQVCL